MTVELICGDALDILKIIPDQSVNCCVTSPPYYGLRDFGVDGQIGLESTPEEYVENIVNVFREVKRILRDDGTAWVNMGDSYAGSGGAGGDYSGGGLKDGQPKLKSGFDVSKSKWGVSRFGGGNVPTSGSLKPKDLIGIPWRVAFALQADGWWLRSDIIWSKPNPMPESVTDRPTKAHEYIFLLSKSAQYYYDAEAIKEPGKHGDTGGNSSWRGERSIPKEMRQKGAHGSFHREGRAQDVEYTLSHSHERNKRSVWIVATRPFPEAHFATFPPKLVEPCILAGCHSGGTVLDPFSGAGTTGVVCVKHGRNYIGIELNPEYVEMSQKRLDDAQRQIRMDI